jgi:RHS repeat-associated protein
VTPSGTVAERYEYDAWGNVLGVFDGNGNPLTSDLGLPTSALGNRYLFQGREYSWAIHAAWGGAGLYYFRARWYDPATGRWLSRDPIEEGDGGDNLYSFVVNNPGDLFDVLGLVPGPCVCPAGSNTGKRAKDPAGYKPEENGCGPGGLPLNQLVPEDPAGGCPFTPACNGHDRCYGTCNSGKGNCDKQFLDDLLALCNSCASDGKPKYMWVRCGPSKPPRRCKKLVDASRWKRRCESLARIYYRAVAGRLANASYREGQNDGCEDCCCP